jgi:hypothetical protein
MSHTDQIVLMMARLEAGPSVKRPKTLKGEMENNCIKLSDLEKTGIMTV